jgi:hypothetical protein
VALPRPSTRVAVALHARHLALLDHDVDLDLDLASLRL